MILAQRSWRRSIPLALLSLITAHFAMAEPSKSLPLGDEELYALAPYVAQIINLALFDPVLAASLVPDPWIDSVATGALAVEAEVAVKPGKPDSPHPWPIGPWTSPASLAASINAVEPRAVASLYAALRPRLALNCRQRGTSIERCERAMQIAISRLSAPSVRERATRNAAAPITPTQQALARLGEPVVLAIYGRLRGLHTALWSDPKDSRTAR